MKIAQVNVYFKPFMVGGAEWYVYNISRRLTKMGHEVHVYTVDTYNGQKEISEEDIEGINVHRLPLRIDLSYRLKVWRGLKESLIKSKFDIVHTYDYPQWHSRVALRSSKESKSASALTVFDVHSLIPRSWYKQFPMKFFEKTFAKGILNSADRVLVRAPTLLSSLRSMGVQEEKMVVTPSGINDESLGHFDGRKFRNRFGISGSPLILCLSRLNPLKGPQVLISAAQKILEKYPNANLAFVGPNQGGYERYLRELSKKIGIEKMIYFTGPIYDFQQKMEAYASCDVFVLPSSYEGTSQAIFEAMAQAKPIVSTNVGGIPTQIEDGVEGLLVPFGDENDLANSVLKLLSHPTLADELGKNAMKKVAEYRYSLLAQQLVNIYDGIVGSA